jgi:hypothetical protein
MSKKILSQGINGDINYGVYIYDKCNDEDWINGYETLTEARKALRIEKECSDLRVGLVEITWIPEEE